MENRFDYMGVQMSDEAEVEEGAGEFAHHIAGELAAFENGWDTTFDLASTSAGIIAGNTNNLHLDLTAVDRDLSHAINVTI